MVRILARLGEDAAITPDGGALATVRGMFLEPFRDVLGGMIESSEPRFACMAADLTDIAHGDGVVVSAGTFTVSGIEPDPVSGITVLTLRNSA